MTGAMYSAIGGLRSHMSKLNVIGNNIANVNTYGYKAQRMTFKESIYNTSRSGSNGGVTNGGNNPSQVGYGCSVGSIDLNMSPSTYAPTGVNLDCFIDGEGFFLVGDKLTKEEQYDEKSGEITDVKWSGGIVNGNQLKDYELTRVGDFQVDADGYICNSDGKILYGFARVQNPDYVPDASKKEISLAKAQGIDIESETIISTHLVPLRVPLAAAAPTKENGGKIETQKQDEDGVGVTDENGDPVMEETKLWEEGDPVYPFLSTEGLNQYADPELEEKTKQATRPETNTGNATADLPKGPGRGSSCIAVAENTAVDAVSNVMPCQMRDMSVDSNGAIIGVANGKTVVIGYIAIASADNPNGVTHVGGPYYKCMAGAGNLSIATVGVDLPTSYLGNKVAPDQELTEADIANGVKNAAAIDRIKNESGTEIQGGGLEASSTDLAYEFAEMVTTQRGYQANTRIVSVTDSMLEELVNMKR